MRLRRELGPARGAAKHTAMQRSQRTFIQDQLPEFVNRIASAAGSDRARVFASLDSLIDVEFYMPVKDHWAAWKGGSDLIVAAALHDHEPPVAYNLNGEPVTIASADVPPPTPALVLVPVETAFSHAAAQGGEAPQAPMTSTPGVWMTYSYIADSHEGWLMGDPEFEVHVFKANQYGTWTDVTCSGAQMTGEQYWDQNSTYWGGNVLLISQTGIGEDSVSFEMWEDDDVPCTSTGGRPPKTSINRFNQIRDAAALANSVRKFWNGGGWVDKYGLPIAMAVPSAYDLIQASQIDDFVGIMEGPVGGCWHTMGSTERYNMTVPGEADAGYAYLKYTYGEPAVWCALDAIIDGPTEIHRSSQGVPTPAAYYTAGTSGGNGSYSYQWWDDGTAVGTGSSYTMDPVTLGTHTIHLRVTSDTAQVDRYMDTDVLACGPGDHCPESPVKSGSF